MENSALFALLSIVVVLLTSLFKQVKFTPKQKNLIATVLSLLAGTTMAYTDGSLTASALTSSAIAVYGAAQLAYNFILKGTGLDKILTDTNLFGSNAAQVEETLESAKVVEKAVRKTKKSGNTASKSRTKVN